MVVEREVRVAGVVLAAALADVATAEGDCCGLVLGSVGDRLVRKATDADADASAQLVSYAAEAFVRCPRPFYDAAGCLRRDVLQSLAATHQAGGREVIGWWRFRRNTPLAPSLREAAVHRALSAMSGPLFQSAAPLFVLFGERHAAGGAIRGAEFRVLLQQQQQQQHSSFVQVDPIVTNLVSSSHAEYGSFASSGGSAATLPAAASTALLAKETPPAHVREIETILAAVNAECETTVAEIERHQQKQKEQL